KLFEANEAEIASLLTTISANQTLVDNIPALKSQQISAGKKLTEAAVFKSNSEKAAEPSKKLSSLVNATRKQNAAISQLNKLVSDISVAALSGPPPVAVVTPSQTPQVTESTGVAANETSLTATNPGTAAPPLLLLNPDSLVQKDTSTADLLVYLDLQNTGLRNEQAYAASGSALKNLKRIETEQMNIRDNKKNMETLSTMLENTQDPAMLRQNADNIDNESEQTAALALEKRRSAGSAPENEKAGLMAEARALENQSLNQRFLSTLINQKAFDIDYKTNDVALSELKSKLGADNQKLDATQDQLNIDIQNLNAQISKLKEEAAGLPNRSAQLGALSNVDEKEREIIKKQKELIESLRIKYPDYIVNPLSPDTVKAMMQAPQDYSARENELATDQINELTNLTNAFTLEFENSRSQVPAQLSAEQDAVKQNAERLNENSKQLLLEASKESDPAVKAKKMNQAAKLGHAALVQLDALLPASSRKMNSKGSDLASLTEIGNTINQGSPGQENGGDALVIEGLEVVKGNAYSAAKPIPFNAPTEKGLSFRVQIGAFRTQLPNNTFKGLSPVNGETTRTGYFRYTAGNFKKIEQANAVKNDLRKLGYRDAFVVAYLDGKRISASEAISMLNQEGKTVDLNAPQSAGITANVNIAKDILSEQNQTVNPQDLAQVASEIEKINGLFYTIQIGVYSRQATKQSLMNLQPIYTKQLPSGLYRYTAGMYNDSVKVLSDKNRVVEMGISDAFIGAYLNGSSIPYSEARSKQANDPSIRMEAENPIVFPGLPSPASVVPDIKPADPNVKPFTNAVSTYPEATEENGIKNTEDGLSFKVQIGAFSKQVPNDVAARFSQIRNWPIENKQLNGLFVYNIGNFKSARFAKELKDEAVKLGITDAFIVVYLDGKKLYGAEANALLSR
ncbi:MAG TPA: hypothetical protein PLQ93_13485, partial [Bacteroidia bacterium]|nr:hypothetical protein [Bacteroidia bacterium]